MCGVGGGGEGREEGRGRRREEGREKKRREWEVAATFRQSTRESKYLKIDSSIFGSCQCLGVFLFFSKMFDQFEFSLLCLKVLFYFVCFLVLYFFSTNTTNEAM